MKHFEQARPRGLARTVGYYLATSALCTGIAGLAQAQTQDDCVETDRYLCTDRNNADTVVSMPVGETSEVIAADSSAGLGAAGFSISIDGETIAGAPAPRVVQRQQDIALSRANVDVTFDGLVIQPRLNVSTSDLRSTAPANGAVTFRASTNYPAYIARAEIRVIDRQRRDNGRIAAKIPVAPNGEANWTMPATGSGDFAYVLRVYDADGRYNETRPLPLHRSARGGDPDLTGPVIAAGEGEDRTGIAQFKVRGGAVTVHGDALAPGQTVRVMGETIPVDQGGAFVTQRILPAGTHAVDVRIDPHDGVAGERLVRDIEVPERDLFFVGIADISANRRIRDNSDGSSETTDSVDGRLAFYLKGTFQNNVSVTASADTGHGSLANAFSRLDQKDPLTLLGRLRDDAFYPTYGDNSTAYDDTPTSGRFYLKVETPQTEFLWGDFDLAITQPHFLRNTQSLYGARVTHESRRRTEDGAPVLRVLGYAAQGDMASRRDVLEATGGSAYFLSHQDIHPGSDTVTVETIDPRTGRIVDSRTLVAGQDYELDPLQGVLLLSSPLGRSAPDGSLIQSNPGGDNVVRLVVTYQNTPALGSVDGGSVGGRIELRPNDRITLGFTAMRDDTGTADQRMIGADARFALGEYSFAEFEVAQSQGPGFGQTLSVDGGLTIDALASSGAPGLSARAYRFDAHLALSDLGIAAPGFIDLYAESIEAGFSTYSHDISEDQRLVGIAGEIGLSDRATLRFSGEHFRKSGGEQTDEAEISLTYALSPSLELAAGLAWLHQDRPGTPAETGERTDALLRLTYSPSEDLTVYGYARATLALDGGLERADRIGLGADVRLSERLRFSGEVSDGTGGFGAVAQATWTPSEGQEFYVSYAQDPDSRRLGTDAAERLTFGAKNRVNKRLSTFAENSYISGRNERSLTRAFGVTYTPNDRWTLASQVELGRVTDPRNGDFDRFAYSVSMTYSNGESFNASAKLEYRLEDGIGSARDRETLLLSAAFDYRTSPNWHLLGSLDAVLSRSDESDFRNGDYVRASLGYAYRPTDNDRTNALIRLTYINDQPGEDQVTANGTTDGPRHRSLVFSADLVHELSDTWTVGLKYGYRSGETADRGTDNYVRNDAHLAIARFDWHVVHNWDLSIEGRWEYQPHSGDTRTGGSIAIYRHVGNNLKIGVGYDVGQATNDLTNVEYKERGVFVNLVAKF
ncbi:hypothetical protein [Pseudaestuariivita atlantica]|uniref:Autotransporter domain-containing protein n=1 Tax=Pseudaestuariivita atlantica TaxID=1317121 RepID=A0A0L1JK89_9RHOB|nr:hypothetical protein [Pseudaestuariivita atlantica]KNG92174.1 hypothetical protein ATO11_18840 [Pseudaestuariivita atlantica]